MVYLGCVTDAAGRPREWIELWIQNADGLDASLPALREAFSNQTLDQRWSRHSDAVAALDAAAALHTGWEKVHPQPPNLAKVRLAEAPLAKQLARIQTQLSQ